MADLGRRSDYWLNQQGRLTEPMVKRPGADHYEPIGWDAALDLVAREPRALGSPDEALFYTSGRLNNEAAFLLQLFARAYGTNNLPDCSHMCHESSGSALQETLGIGKGSVSWTTSTTPTWSSWWGRTPAPTTPGCSPPLRRPSATAGRSSRSTHCPRPA